MYFFSLDVIHFEEEKSWSAKPIFVKIIGESEIHFDERAVATGFEPAIFTVTP